MAKKKNLLGIIIPVVVVLAIAAVILAVVFSNGKKDGDEETTPQQTTPSKKEEVVKGTAIKGRVSVHDPSIIIGEDNEGKKCYYIFGSHMAWAKSYDLQNWKSFKNNINTDYLTLFADAFDWANNGDSVYSPSGNLWAPDVIYNEAMGKWCMYMSINGCSWNSSIVLLTADTLEGDWTPVGTVIYSGFTPSGTYSYEGTDYVKATGDAGYVIGKTRYTRGAYSCKDGNTRCEATTWNNGNCPHAIDPCVLYDEDGNLWMVYGSWSGGIWMLELDENTGLRDYTVKYEATDLTNP